MDDSDAAELFAALGLERRLQILRQVARHPEGVAVGRLAQTMDMRQNTLSAHLKILARCDLVIGHRTGREIKYRMLPVTLQRLQRYLTAKAAAAG